MRTALLGHGVWALLRMGDKANKAKTVLDSHVRRLEK
jgi:hypothetical protein